jgi:uncharacterized protein YcbK (DUF882 family)
MGIPQRYCMRMYANAYAPRGPIGPRQAWTGANVAVDEARRREGGLGLTTSTIRLPAPLTRRSTVLAVVISLVPLLGGCVSAVDDSNAFGFNGATAAGTDAAGAPKEEASGAEGEDAATQTAETDPAADPASPGGAEATRTAEAAATATTPPAAASPGPVLAENDDAKHTGPLIDTDRAPVAAYAGASVGAVSESVTKAGAPKADSTLFASLFAQSEAKTPVRNADTGKSRRVILKPEGAPVSAGSSDVTTLASLPGVKTRASLFEIGQRASADYDADILDEASGDQDSYQLASLGGMARLAPNGLMVQRPDVQTNCFDSKLVAVLRAVEARFNTKVVVTSGYRSPSHNRAVRGAKASMHMSCKAADILVPGADKMQVANFVRSLPGRGGVGTYCHTLAIHVDTGRERDWSWSCRRRRA